MFGVGESSVVGVKSSVEKFGNTTGRSTHFSNRNSFQEEAIINCRNSVTNSQSTNFVTFESLKNNNNKT